MLVIIPCVLSSLTIIQVVHYLNRPADKQRWWYMLLLIGVASHSWLSTIGVYQYWTSLCVFLTSMCWGWYFVSLFGLKSLRSYFNQKITIILSVLPFGAVMLSSAFKVSLPELFPAYYSAISLYVVCRKLNSERRMRLAFNSASIVFLGLTVWVITPIVGLMLDTSLTYIMEGAMIVMILANQGVQIQQNRSEHADHQSLQRSFPSQTISLLQKQDRLIQEMSRLLKEYNGLPTPIRINDVPNLSDKLSPARVPAAPTTKDTGMFDETPALTDRELEVAQLIKDGMSTKEIAQILSISAFTAKRHLSNLYAKYKVPKKTDLINKLKGVQLRKDS